MTAPSGSVPSSPFLAFVGAQDRNPLRVGLWLALGLPLAGLALILVGTAAQALDPALVAWLQMDGPFTGPHRLLTQCRYLCLITFLELGAALAILGAARVAFQRPAWTFVSPVRHFAPSLLAWGVLVYGVLAMVGLGLDALQGAKLVPPILSAQDPETERMVYALASLPLILLAAAAEEILFRGVLLQVTGAYIKTRFGLCVVNGLVFALMHVDPSPMAFLGLALMGGVFAWSVLELGGLEFSIGAHFINNALILLLQQPLSAAAKTPPFQWSDLAQLDAWTGLAESAAISTLTVVAVQLISRRRARRAQA
jgi:membrane protease YdiL (CAAX protease family)